MTLNARLARLEVQIEPDDTRPLMTVEEIVETLEALRREVEANAGMSGKEYADLLEEQVLAGNPPAFLGETLTLALIASLRSSCQEEAQRLWEEKSFYPGFLRRIGYGAKPLKQLP